MSRSCVGLVSSLLLGRLSEILLTSYANVLVLVSAAELVNPKFLGWCGYGTIFKLQMADMADTADMGGRLHFWPLLLWSSNFFYFCIQIVKP